MTKETNPIKLFHEECKHQILAQGNDPDLFKTSKKWLNQSSKHKYSYHFSWLGRPIIQLPQDILAIQEIIWNTKPDIVIETGIAHGGSLCFTASMLSLLDVAEINDPIENQNTPKIERKVIGVDIDIRKHNRDAIRSHPLANKIVMLEGSSIEQAIYKEIRELIPDGAKVMIMLDSNHTEEHVLEELRLYKSLVTKNSYLIVCDTIVAQMPPGSFEDRPWDINNNPKGAVEKFLKESKNFVVDTDIDNKLLLSMSPKGYLRRVA